MLSHLLVVELDLRLSLFVVGWKRKLLVLLIQRAPDVLTLATNVEEGLGTTVRTRCRFHCSTSEDMCAHHSRFSSSLLALEEDRIAMAAVGTGDFRMWQLDKKQETVSTCCVDEERNATRSETSLRQGPEVRLSLSSAILSLIQDSPSQHPRVHARAAPVAQHLRRVASLQALGLRPPARSQNR